MEIRTPEELINFINSLNLEELCIDSISLKFNRNKWLKKAIDDGKDIIGKNVLGEPFWDEYVFTNAKNKTEEEIKSGMQKWFDEVWYFKSACKVLVALQAVF